MGADVTGFSHSENKREGAERLGADHFHPTDDESVFQPLGGTFDLVVSTVSADLPLGSYLAMLRIGGWSAP
ncbi:zinc-binding dehydrogenase [Streptomyces sp. NPDC004232]|uniref:zinc-binding dehydrogenase n=1 Tax=Streptomyces sp. NPDC004232 TaxID=3154454 RepID=UPI0033AC93EA